MSIDVGGEGGPHNTPHEQSREPEGEQRTLLNPVAARVILGAVDPKYYEPTRRGAEREDLDALKTKTPDSIQYQPVNAVLTDSCIEYYHNDKRDLADIVQTWNRDFANHIKEMTNETVDLDLRERRIVAFKSLGITADTIDDEEFIAQVDTFRTTYLAHNAADGSLVEANLGKFIHDVGNDFEAIQDILTIFGADPKDKILIESHVQAHGFLSQPEEIKSKETASFDDQLKRELSEAQRDALQALHDKQPTTRQRTSQRQPPSRSPESTAREKLDSWVGADKQLPSMPDQHERIEKPFEDMSADEVADELIDYKTGKVTNNRQLNLKESYESAYRAIQEYVQTNPGYYGEGNTYVISDVAYAMIGRIAEESNTQQKDFPLLLCGKVIPHAYGNVHFIGLASPGVNFSQSTELDENELFTRSRQLIDSTGLNETFDIDSYITSSLILHTRHLNTDRAAAPYAFTETDRNFAQTIQARNAAYGNSIVSGVVTAVPGEPLAMNIVLTQRGEYDTVQHTEHLRWDYMPSLEEERDKVDPSLHQRFISADGNGYMITKMHKGNAVEVVSDTGETITGDPLNDILSGSRWETIDEKRERIEARHPAVGDEPLDDHILYWVSKYLHYNDIKLAHNAPVSMEDDRDAFNTPPWNYYAREFANMIETYTENWLYTIAQKNIAELSNRLQSLNIPLTEESQSPSWYLLGVAEKRVLAAHEDIKIKYVPDPDNYLDYDPLLQYMPGAAGESASNSQQAEEDIVSSMLGGEIYRHNRLYNNVTLSAITDNTDQQRAHEILSELPLDGQDTIALYKLQELGKIFTKYIPRS